MIQKIVLLTGCCLLLCQNNHLVAEGEHDIDREIHALERQMADAAGKEKVDLLNELSYKSYSTSARESIAYAERALKLAEKIGYRQGRGNACYHLSWAYVGAGNYKKARYWIEKSLKIQRELKNREQIAKSLDTMGTISRNLGENSEALEFHLKAMKFKLEKGDEKELAISYLKIGNVYNSLSEYAKAENYYRKSLSLFIRLKHQLGMLNCYNNIGLVYDYRSRYRKAVLNYKKALNISIQIGNRKGIANAYNNLGNVSKNLSNYSEALDYYQESLKTREEMDDRPGQAESLHNMGLVYNHIGDYARALDCFQKSLTIEDQTGDRMGMADTYNAMGNTYENLSATTRALGFYEKALVIYKDIDDKWGVAASLNDMGQLKQKENRVSEALDLYSKARKIFQEIGNTMGMADCLKLQADIHKRSGELERCLRLYDQSMDLYQKIGNKQGTAACLTESGHAMLIQKNYSIAKRRLAEGLALARSINAREIVKKNYLYMSNLFRSVENYKDALINYEKFHATDREIFSARSSRQLANLQVRYQVEKKQSEIARLEKEKKIQTLELSRSKIMRNASAVGLILAVVILALLFRKYVHLFTFWKSQKYVGQYRLVDKIGTGGMGTVYRAHNIKNRSDTVAVKILKEELFGNPENRKRFEREAKTVSGLDHPHIVKIREWGQYRDTLYIAMEFFSGITLADKISRDNRLPTDEVTHVLHQIAETLSFVHSRGVVHRDLKPGNILLIKEMGDPNYVKLLDFGISRSGDQTRLTRTGSVMGTTRYMSPEQFSDQDVSTKSDIYSLGIIVYEMLCGTSPYRCDSTFVLQREIQQKDARQSVEKIPGIPIKLKQLVGAMVEKDPKERISARKILDYLFREGLISDRNLSGKS